VRLPAQSYALYDRYATALAHSTEHSD
jgi:hypothetical protein